MRSGLSSNRMSVRMALMYKKEALQGKISRGEIDANALELALRGNRSAQRSDKPSSIGCLPADEDDGLDETDQETPQKDLPAPQVMT